MTKEWQPARPISHDPITRNPIYDTTYSGRVRREMNAPSIPLTKREYSLLLMDILDVGPDAQTKDIADELRRGCSVHATTALLEELSEFVDRDDDPRERAAYRRLLRKARSAIAAAEEE